MNTRKQAQTVSVTLYDIDGNENFHELPAKFEVCPRCHGQGSHVNPSIDGNGLTASDFAEDPSFGEDYFSGAYDVSCYDCHGLRVVSVIDEDRCDPKLLEAYYDQQREEAMYAAESAAERRMGC